MFVDDFEDMFEGLGLFKCSLRTYNDEVLTSFKNTSLHKFFFIEVIFYDAKHGSK
jgi:hypothetical protein